MHLGEAITRMEQNPGLKMTMPRHYRSWQYNYYDAENKMFCIEDGTEWDIDKSIAWNEMDGYEDYNENKGG